MKINLTKLLETNCVYWGNKYPTDASDYIYKENRTSLENPYSFELEDRKNEDEI